MKDDFIGYLGLEKVFDVSDLELVRWYYCEKINKDVIKRRRGERVERFGDKYTTVSRARRLDECLKRVDLDEFFNQSEVINEGLSWNGFMEYLMKLKSAYEMCVKTGGLIDIGWKN